VKIVTDSYAELLRPYIHEGSRDNHDDYSTSSVGSHSDRKAACVKCMGAYELLGLPVGASKDEIGQRKKEYAKILHRDALGGKSESIRNAAEERLKNFNAACSQITGCKCSESTN
jgi:DnaJ-class molecular chaperone